LTKLHSLELRLFFGVRIGDPLILLLSVYMLKCLSSFGQSETLMYKLHYVIGTQVGKRSLFVRDEWFPKTDRVILETCRESWRTWRSYAKTNKTQRLIWITTQKGLLFWTTKLQSSRMYFSNDKIVNVTLCTRARAREKERERERERKREREGGREGEKLFWKLAIIFW
jgi:hypothetical protein